MCVRLSVFYSLISRRAESRQNSAKLGREEGNLKNQNLFKIMCPTCTHTESIASKRILRVLISP